MTDSFHDDLVTLLPPLRIYARTLTRRPDEAADLLQETIAHALVRRAQFQPGTNLRAWTHRIMRNLSIDNIRRRRPTEELDADEMDLATPPTQFDAIVHAEFLKAFDQLAPYHREALILSAIEGRSYEEIAAICGCAQGTIKSRVCRARDTLMRLMLGEAPEVPPARSARLAANRRAERPAAG
jgi:RNA polymerase sigma-70 factor (ECF subfamily)